MTDMKCPLGDDCDLTIAWMMGAERAKDTIKAQAAEIERLRAALRMLYDEMDEYQRINKLSAYNNHVMCLARDALEGPQDPMAKPLEGK